MSANFRKHYLKPCPITKFGIIAHVLLLIAHVLPLIAHVLPLTAHCSQLIAHVLASLALQEPQACPITQLRTLIRMDKGVIEVYYHMTTMDENVK
jgi:hypothetical protein